MSCENPSCSKPRRGPRISTCSSSACKRWLATVNQAKRARFPGDVAGSVAADEAVAPAQRESPNFCYEVEDVLGQAYCRVADLDGMARRCGRDLEDEEVVYLVRGMFGECEDDRLWSDTRWVTLTELVKYVEEEALEKALSEYEKSMPGLMRDSRERLRQKLGEEDEERS